MPKLWILLGFCAPFLPNLPELWPATLVGQQGNVWATERLPDAFFFFKKTKWVPDVRLYYLSEHIRVALRIFLFYILLFG